MDILIATDIDGTLTDRHHKIPEEVFSYLEGLCARGLDLLFVTGRPFSRGYKPIQHAKFPHMLAVYNGSLMFKMPEIEIFHRNYLEQTILEKIALICKDEPTDLVVYGGYEHQDVCYYRPRHFSKEILDYVNYRCEFLNEKWVPIETFDDIPIAVFPAVKCFGTRESLLNIQKQLESTLEVAAPVITDALQRNFCLAQITKKGVDKGQAIESVKALNPKKSYVTIACGDDYNDLQMLRNADIAVVMATAPPDLLAIADVIAPPSEHHGIIVGINEALKRLL